MNVSTQMIEVPAEGGTMPACLARLESTEATPAVVLIQEAFGLNEHIRDVARRIAAEGYVVLAPDMFWRGGKARTAGYAELPKALGLMGELKDDQIVADVGSAIGYLERQAFVRADRIGITGFCMGGRVSYLAACKLPGKLKAAAPFYGGGIPVGETAGLAAPVLAFFGEDDPFIPLAQVEQLKAEAKRLGKQLEVIVYPKAPHGFFCNERDSYRAPAAADAWTRLKAFFAAHLAA